MRVPALVVMLLMATTAVQAQPVDPAPPEGVHLQWRGDAGQYAVRFHAALSQQDYDVAYTVDGEEQATSIGATSPGYGRSSGYGFRVDANASSYRIEDRSFPIVGPPPHTDDAVRVAFLGDIGMTENTGAVLDSVRAANVSAILAGGDLSYADGDVDVWDDWFDFMEPYISDVPIMPARGNHEARCLGRGGVGVVADCNTDESMYLSRFDLPLEELYYATEWGPLRIIVVDTEAYFHRDDPIYTINNVDPDEQLAFLADALRAPEDMWTLVMMHRPTYSSSGGHGSELGIRAHMEPALVDGGADLVLAGHDHDYERTLPVIDGEPQAEAGDRFTDEAPIYVVSGGGGQSLYTSWQPMPAWGAVREAAYHFVLIEADQQRLTVTALTPDGDELDRFTIERDVDPEDAGEQQRSPAIAVGVLLVALLIVARRR